MGERSPESTSQSPRSPGRSGLWPLVLGLAAILVLGLALLFVFDPSRHSFYPACVFKRLTGYDCPGCGGLRAAHAVLHGRVLEAIHLNALVVIGLPLLLVVLTLRHTGQRARPNANDPRVQPNPLWPWGVALGLVVAFGLLRNLPIWPFGITPP